MPSHNEISFSDLISHLMECDRLILKHTPIFEEPFETILNPTDVLITLGRHPTIELGSEIILRDNSENLKVYEQRWVLLSDTIALHLQKLEPMEITKCTQ